MAKIFWNMTVRNSETNPAHVIVTHGDGWTVTIDASNTKVSVAETMPGKDCKPVTEAQIRKAIEFADVHGWI